MDKQSVVRAIAALLSAAIPSVATAQGEELVYALCSVRDVTMFQNGDVDGKIYRSAIFSAPADYDDEISLKPNKGGLVSRHFEAWVAKTKGLRPDRVSLGNGDEHSCIEAPLTPAGENEIIKTAQAWSVSNPRSVKEVFTDWTPWLGRRVGRLVPPSAEAIAQYEAALKARQQKIAADQQQLDQAEAEAAAVLAAHEAELAKARAAQVEYERRQQQYREEYYRVTGRYPDN